MAGTGHDERARVLGALQASAATTVECELSREFGVAWIPRADGGATRSRASARRSWTPIRTRTVQVHEKERELA